MGDGIRRMMPSLDRLLRHLSLRAQIAILLAVAMMPVGIFAMAQATTNYAEVKRFSAGSLRAGGGAGRERGTGRCA